MKQRKQQVNGHTVELRRVGAGWAVLVDGETVAETPSTTKKHLAWILSEYKDAVAKFE